MHTRSIPEDRSQCAAPDQITVQLQVVEAKYAFNEAVVVAAPPSSDTV